jgi:hypothetical protein
LAKGFSERCGYGAMYIAASDGTVDHYRSTTNRRELSYVWSNYRYVSAGVNASKQAADECVLDPYEVGEGWFEVIVPSMQLCLTERVPQAQRARAAYTLQRLKLGNGEKFIRQRAAWFRMYTEGKLSLEGLDQVAPLIADAIRRQGSRLA